VKLDHNLKLEQVQKLIITPELKLAITLLQYSSQELQDHIQEELLNNPVLEVQENRETDKEDDKEIEPPAPEELPVDADFPWEEYFRDMDIDTAAYSAGKTNATSVYQTSVENCARMSGCMLEDLLGQLRLLSLTARQYRLAAYLAGNLDHNGYLQCDIGELAAALGADTKELEKALRIIQRLEPPGIGCRSLQECLLLQLERLEKPPLLTADIIRRFLPAVADCRYRYIATRLGCEEQVVLEAVDFIRTLNPKPGSVFGEGEEVRYIVPDVIAEKVNDHYAVTNNESSIPQLAISPFYQKMLNNDTNDEQLSAFIKNKIEKAYWLIRSIEQRRLTLFRVSQQIIDIQKPFLDHGIKKLKPLTLKEVALNIGVHESTVSRATANKYIQTSRGIFPLKFFFSSGLTGTGGSDYSSHSIKTYIRELVAAENQEKPLSDQKLADLLEEKGINISRRTVAKYREEISIPASYKRHRSQTYGRK